MRCWLTDIRKHAQFQASRRKNILNRFPGIVRHRKRRNFQGANREGTMAIDDAQVEIRRIRPTPSQSAMGQPDRQAEFTGQTKNTADMVAMLMRDNDAGQVLHPPFEPLQTRLGFLEPEAAIEHQAGFARLDEQRITSAATAERGETNHCNCCSSRPRIFLAVSDLSVPPSADNTFTTLCWPSS